MLSIPRFCPQVGDASRGAFSDVRSVTLPSQGFPFVMGVTADVGQTIYSEQTIQGLQVRVQVDWNSSLLLSLLVSSFVFAVEVTVQIGNSDLMGRSVVEVSL